MFPKYSYVLGTVLVAVFIDMSKEFGLVAETVMNAKTIIKKTKHRVP